MNFKQEVLGCITSWLIWPRYSQELSLSIKNMRSSGQCHRRVLQVELRDEAQGRGAGRVAARGGGVGELVEVVQERAEERVPHDLEAEQKKFASFCLS